MAAKIHDSRIPYQVPLAEELPDRLDTALQVVYLVFKEGYSAPSGASLTRAGLSAKTIRLGRLLLELLAVAMRDGPEAGLAQRAWSLTQQEHERRFLENRLRELD